MTEPFTGRCQVAKCRHFASAFVASLGLYLCMWCIRRHKVRPYNIQQPWED